MDPSTEIGSESAKYSDDIQQYDLRHEIGVGSFGRVFEAEDRSSGRLCAIKRISKQNNPNPRKVQSEVEIQKRASDHDNIVRLFQALEDDKFVYLIMELCAGGSLKSLIRSTLESCQRRSPEKKVSPCSGYGSFRRSSSQTSLKSPSLSTSDHSTQPVLPYDVIRSVIRQVCHGLDYLHRNGVVHRDLNVNNLLLESRVSLDSKRCAKEIKVKIADFGLALDMKNVDANGFVNCSPHITAAVGNTICGTPGFISPEVWRQTTPVSPASDVFSLGSIIYAMVTGITSPKGDLDVSSFPPLLASIMCSLLHEKPEKRLQVKDILDHPFTLGPICTKRLRPTTVTARNQRFTIHSDFSVSLSFLDKDCEITISKDSAGIVIRTRKSSKKYSLETLPFSRWKWYSRVHDFIRTVRSTTPKIKKFCIPSEGSHHKVSSIDSKGSRITILGGILSEAGTFKAFILDDLSGEHKKVQLSQKLREENSVLYGQVKDLYETCLKLEDALESFGQHESEDCFPVTSGRNPLKSGIRTHDVSPKDKSMTLTKCITIDDVRTASKVPDGFRVTFTDGSSLTYYTNSTISYCESPQAPQSVYTASSHLPAIVQRKLAVIPALINSPKATIQYDQG